MGSISAPTGQTERERAQSRSLSARFVSRRRGPEQDRRHEPRVGFEKVDEKLQLTGATVAHVAPAGRAAWITSPCGYGHRR